MRSESTSALGQPKLTKPTFGLLRLTVFTVWQRGGRNRGEIVLQSPTSRPITGRPGRHGPRALRRRTTASKSPILRPGANKSASEAPWRAKEPPNWSDKELECVTGPPEGVKCTHRA